VLYMTQRRGPQGDFDHMSKAHAMMVCLVVFPCTFLVQVLQSSYKATCFASTHGPLSFGCIEQMVVGFQKRS
jgi:hypothetical protein